MKERIKKKKEDPLLLRRRKGNQENPFPGFAIPTRAQEREREKERRKEERKKERRKERKRSFLTTLYTRRERERKRAADVTEQRVCSGNVKATSTKGRSSRPEQVVRVLVLVRGFRMGRQESTMCDVRSNSKPCTGDRGDFSIERLKKNIHPKFQSAREAVSHTKARPRPRSELQDTYDSVWRRKTFSPHSCSKQRNGRNALGGSRLYSCCLTTAYSSALPTHTFWVWHACPCMHT